MEPQSIGEIPSNPVEVHENLIEAPFKSSKLPLPQMSFISG